MAHTLAVGPPPVTPDPGAEYHWAELRANGNIDHYVQAGAGPKVFWGWHGAEDGSFHVVRLQDGDRSSIPTVAVDTLFNRDRVRVDYDRF